ncbi:hypothetical protein Tco_0924685 [Tanacetum coccineum]|uniref:Uncharacterized protein n=1 Tax=Tanacetum coccineum TaxID=301880 RepID=A0ABQ5D4M3_9ASTR
MKDCTYEAITTLSSFGSITKGHTALTSECGSMLEEVLEITRGLHDDVHTLGKEASALHSSLMGDLSKANNIVLPPKSVLSKDVEAMTEVIPINKRTKAAEIFNDTKVATQVPWVQQLEVQLKAIQSENEHLKLKVVDPTTFQTLQVQITELQSVNESLNLSVEELHKERKLVDRAVNELNVQ